MGRLNTNFDIKMHESHQFIWSQVLSRNQQSFGILHQIVPESSYCTDRSGLSKQYGHQHPLDLSVKNFV